MFLQKNNECTISRDDCFKVSRYRALQEEWVRHFRKVPFQKTNPVRNNRSRRRLINCPPAHWFCFNLTDCLRPGEVMQKAWHSFQRLMPETAASEIESARSVSHTEIQIHFLLMSASVMFSPAKITFRLRLCESEYTVYCCDLSVQSINNEIHIEFYSRHIQLLKSVFSN